jgi:hypothetical protein
MPHSCIKLAPVSKDSNSASSSLRLEGARRNPLLATLLEGVAAGLLYLGLTVVLGRVAPPLAPSRHFNEFLAWTRIASPQVFYLVMLVALPLGAEMLLRGLPYLLWLGARRVLRSSKAAQEIVFWFLGLIGAVGLALLPYLFMRRLLEFEFFFPIGLFFVGLWSWNVLRTRGFPYSVLLMLIFNVVAVAVLVLRPQAT